MIIAGTFNHCETEVLQYQFDVGDVNSIHFTLLEGKFEHFFVIVKDPKHEIRSLFTYKTRQKQYCLTESIHTSDNCMIAKKIESGTWTIEIVRSYFIDGGFQISIEFDLGFHPQIGFNPFLQDFSKIINPSEGWYQGDFHLHSSYSDGRVNLEEIIQSVDKKELDFIALTDHTIVTTKFPNCDFLVMPSTEITWDDLGHYNIHGLKEIPDYVKYFKDNKSKNAALNQLLSYFHGNGCVISLNHPFPYGWELKHEFDFHNIDLLEVINAPHLLDEEVDNIRAVCFFDYLWKNGYTIKAIGGSDAHKKNYFNQYPVGIPITKVFCKGLSIDHLLESIKNGNSFIEVEYHFEILFHRLNQIKEVILPGTAVQGPVELKARCDHIVQWQLIKNGEIYHIQYGRKFHMIIDIKKEEYFRLQALSDENQIVLFVNPLHDISKHNKCESSFQTILEKFYQLEALKKEK